VGARPGAAQAVKLANQVMLAANIVGARDGLRLAQAHGLGPDQVLPVIAESTGASWVAEHWEAVAGWLEDQSGALGIILKDLRSAGAERLLEELQP
jgi:3-hydroxyisobutyrate dehydrogenase-like beta-hydroxyacid dehydrogenase